MDQSLSQVKEHSLRHSRAKRSDDRIEIVDIFPSPDAARFPSVDAAMESASPHLAALLGTFEIGKQVA